MSTKPDTIVLVHGFWVTPRSWEKWVAHYEAKGFKVLAPGYPGFEGEVEGLREDPSPIEALTIDSIVDNYASIIEGLGSPPVIIGHSAGGLWTQLLLARGLGAAGAAICSVPTEGVNVVPVSQIRSLFPVLKNPANRHKAVPLSEKQWHYAFANTVSEEESKALWEKYAIGAAGNLVFEGALANIKPGHQGPWLDYKADRAPLVFISGGEDHIMPAKVQASNAKHYSDELVTEHKVFEGRDHACIAEDGWEDIADFALGWTLENAR